MVENINFVGIEGHELIVFPDKYLDTYKLLVITFNSIQENELHFRN